jgi:diguanylate cyclase (GGDEF)-like protein
MDIKTVIAVLILGNIFTVILIFAYQLQYKREKAIDLFLLGNLIEAIAWTLIGLRNSIPDTLSISLGNSVLFLGATLKIIAFLVIKGNYNKTIRVAYIIGLLLSVFIFNSVAIFLNYDNIRASATSGLLVALWIFPVYKLMTEKKSSILQKVIAILYSFALIVFALRAYSGLTPGSTLRLLSNDVNSVLGFISLFLVMLVGNIGFILLSKEKADKELLDAAMYDELTRILNRRTFLLHAEKAISLCARKKEPLSLISMDLDNFKRINDLYGHHFGDMVLKEFAASIKKQLREYDLFGRFGGEEFVVLLPGTNEKEAVGIAERFRSIIDNSTVFSREEVKYTVSLGVVSLIPDDNTTLEFLYKLSDNALYKAKENGKNRIETA